VPLTNWGGNITFSPQRLHRPTSIDELRQIVAGSESVRALGTGHSFNAIADTSGDLVSVADLPHSIELDASGRSVTVAGGVRYAQLAAHINAEGFALHNLGSLPHISVAGACSTGTHGSGVTNGNLSTAVSAMELVTADGELVVVNRDSAGFAGMVLALGALGVVTRLTLDVEPTYDVRQTVYEGLPSDRLDEHLFEVLGSGYSVSVFTDWGPLNQVWVKQRVSESALPPGWMGATPADGPRNPVPGVPAENCTQQLGVHGPWNERLPHFRAEFTPSSGDEVQSEYFVPHEHAVGAIQALRRIQAVIAPVLLVSEIRTVASDGLWISPSYSRDNVALHFTFIQDMAALAPVVAAIEEALAPFDARPHWGKVFSLQPSVVAGHYERFADYQRLVGEWDPNGKFRNAFLDPFLGL
jgi:alditol oxidase